MSKYDQHNQPAIKEPPAAAELPAETMQAIEKEMLRITKLMNNYGLSEAEIRDYLVELRIWVEEVERILVILCAEPFIVQNFIRFRQGEIFCSNSGQSYFSLSNARALLENLNEAEVSRIQQAGQGKLIKWKTLTQAEALKEAIWEVQRIHQAQLKVYENFIIRKQLLVL